MSHPGNLRIGIVICQPERLAGYFPTAAEPDFVPVELGITPDDQILVDELRRRGHRVETVVWGCEVEPLRREFDLLIVRSAWDYMDSDELRRQFLDWLAALERTGMPVENHPRVMLWLMDKRYLLDLAAVGVPIVRTEAVGPGESISLVERFASLGPLVVKPAVSAAGAGLVFLSSQSQAEAFQAEFDARCSVSTQLVQPFLPAIQTHGEWSLVYLGGRYSHAVHKLPGEGQILVHAEQGGSLRFAEPPVNVCRVGDAVAERCCAAFTLRHAVESGQIAFPPLYLRIDVIETPDGALVSECEGVEPELFFRARPGSESTLAELIERSGMRKAE